jgi:hypothetical protein
VPSDVNVNENVWSGAKSPDWKAPVVEVTVWWIPAVLRFVQQTVVPGATAIVAGWNAKSAIEISVEPTAHDDGADGGEPPIAGVLPTSAQTATASVNAARCRTLTNSPRRP